MICDGEWTCQQCRTYNEAGEGARLLAGFEGSEMWLDLVAVSERGRITKNARRQGLRYVAVPIWSRRPHVPMLAFLSTGPITEDSERIDDRDVFIEQELMPIRWETGSLSASRRFLPPARKARLWEAYSPGTSRRCWHLHQTRAEAAACGREMAQRIDGTPGGWQTRSTSEYRQLGRLRMLVVDLPPLLSGLGIDRRLTFWGDSQVVEIEAMEWDDPRFVELRTRAEWAPPPRARPDWEPPPFKLPLQVGTTGEMIG